MLLYTCGIISYVTLRYIIIIIKVKLLLKPNDFRNLINNIKCLQEKNAMAAKLQNVKPKPTNLLKNRLDVLATPRRRADIENIAPKDKTYIIKNKTVHVKPIAQSSPLREMNR